MLALELFQPWQIIARTPSGFITVHGSRFTLHGLCAQVEFEKPEMKLETLLEYGNLLVQEQENVKRVQLADSYLSGAELAGELVNFWLCVHALATLPQKPCICRYVACPAGMWGALLGKCCCMASHAWDFDSPMQVFAISV